jgi:hypothetical protein
MKALYITDEVTTCECCGRSELKATVAMQLSDGGILFYGRTCAARNSGKTSKQIRQEVFAEEARQQRRQEKMAANAKALAAWQANNLNCPVLEVQRRNYHQTGGFSVHGSFPQWLQNRALGLTI